MIMKINRKAILLCAAILLAGAVLIFALSRLAGPREAMVAGGRVHPPLHMAAGAAQVSNRQDADIGERFQRPSKAPPFPDPYTFQDFQKPDNAPPLITKKFTGPEDLILAYYGILRNASNMLGYSGGCGSIGDSGLPYPYAYELFTAEKQKQTPLDQFINSFQGVGHITLLKLLPAYSPPDTPGSQYFMVEIEVITGEKTNHEEQYNHGSFFAYFYGLIAAEKTRDNGWKIKEIHYIPEDFLCAPAHSWFYWAEAIVRIVYGENLKLIDKVDKTEQKGDMVYIYASGGGRQYRFDFVRLTNGYDILLHENILENGVWKETALLTELWKDFKLTINDSRFA